MSYRKRKSKNRHPNWPLRWVILGILISFLAVAVFVPAFRFRYEAAGYEQEPWDLLTELTLIHSMGWFLTLWVFFFGACLGSFLNVVAYRVPNGLTLLGNSRCPWCLVPIKSRYNFPIIGWIQLRARCSSCRLPISVRYVLVEIAAGLLLVWLTCFELVSNGKNLPGENQFQIQQLLSQLAGGRPTVDDSYDWSLVRIFVVHSIVAYTLLTAALMRIDSLKIPRLWQILHLLLVMGLITIWPSDFDFAKAKFQLSEFNGLFPRFDFQLTGLCIGAFLGLQFQQIDGNQNSGLWFAWMLIGTCCGIPGTLSTAIIFLSAWILCFAWNVRGSLTVNPLFLVLISFLIQVAFWSGLDQIDFWPTTTAPVSTLAFYMLPTTLAVVLVTSLRGPNTVDKKTV